MVVCWCALFLAVFVFPSSKSLVCLVAVACWAVLPLVVRGTTAYKQYYRPPAWYYRCGAEQGGYIGAGGGFFSPIPIRFAPSFLFLSPASTRRGRAPADLRLRGVPLHFLRWSRSPPRSLAMDASIAPVPSLLLSRFQILFLRGNGGCISRFLAKSRLE